MHTESNPCGDLRSRFFYVVNLQNPQQAKPSSQRCQNASVKKDTACDVLPSSLSNIYIHD